jgi:alpha-L-fucosidase
MRKMLELFASCVVAISLGTCAFAQSYEQKIEAAMQKVDAGIPQGPFAANWDSLQNYKIPAWYEDAKFGIFLHWGLYSVPAFNNEWYSRNMYQPDMPEFKHHLETYGPQTKFGYKDFIALFKAEKFDARRWAELFRKTGAKYVVPVAEHHDGFSMYANSYSEWNAVKMGPKRDVIGELSVAIRQQGLHFGLSSHRAEHYWFFDGGRKFDSDVQDPKYADFYGDAVPQEQPPTQPFLKDWLARSAELVDKYNPELIYFDWWIGEKPEYAPYVQKFAAYYYDRAAERKAEVVLNYKNTAMPENTAVLDVERGHFTDTRARHWQTDTSISWKSWCYIENDDLKSPEALIQLLVDVVSKNGNLLLNVGPKADGTFAPEAEQRMLAIGRWLEVNGEAIYGTRPWKKFGEGPAQMTAGAFKEGSDKPYTSEDIRFTTKPGALYAIAMKRPSDNRLLIKSLPSTDPSVRIGGVSVLGSSSNVNWQATPGGVAMELPSDVNNELPIAVKIVLKE